MTNIKRLTPRFTDSQQQNILAGKVRCFASTVDLAGGEADIIVNGHAYIITGREKMELNDLMTAHWRNLGYTGRTEAFDHWESTHLEKTWFGIEQVYLYHFIAKEKV